MTDHPAEWHELARKYEALGTIAKAADAMGISFSTARARLVRMGVQINAKGPSSWRVILTGEQCRNRRIELGLSQPELGEKAGATVATISNFENGKRTPRAETQRKLAEALGLSSEDETS